MGDNLGLTPVQQATDPLVKQQLYNLGACKKPGRDLAIKMPGDISLAAALQLANQSRVYTHVAGTRSLPTSPPANKKGLMMTRSTGALKPLNTKLSVSPLSMSQPRLA